MGESTRCCTFELDPAGFVHAVMRDGAEFELEDAKEAIAATWRVAGERRRGVLVDSRGVRSQSKGAREYFKGEEAARRFAKVALLVDSPLSRMLANFFLSLGEHRIVTKLFTDEAAARAWLEQPDERA